MKQFKFRAWNKSKAVCKMLDWQFLCQLGVKDVFARENLIPMQYTGLTDKNGVEIYEGDIVQWAGKYNDDIANYSLDGKDVEGLIGTVKIYPSRGVIVKLAHKYRHTRQNLYDTDVTEYTTPPIWQLWNSKEEWAVIGNIYENSGLLEGK